MLADVVARVGVRRPVDPARQTPRVSVAPDLTWQLGLALALLVAMAVGVSLVGRARLERETLIAVTRAAVQLALVAVVITAVLEHEWSSLLFAGVMFVVASITAAGRVGARPSLPWVAVTVGGGALPVLIVIFGTGAVEFSGPGIVAISGIVIGGSMTAHTLAARRAFDVMRTDRGQIEAGLALGLDRALAISNVIGRHTREAVLPVVDQTRTVGLVTLPGAFVGVLLGGGSARDAAAAQLIVLVGLLAAETSVAVFSQRLIADGRILPADLRRALPRR